MQLIITPTDFSPASRNACFYAAKMAEAVHARLLLVHVVELPVAITEFSEVVDMTEATGAKPRLQELLDALCLETNNNIDIEAAIVSGHLEKELTELCNHKKPFAVVMATNSHSAFERFFEGSTTGYASRHLHFPVIVVPATAQYKPVNKIALASDLKNLDAMPAHEIETIVKSFSAELEIFHVSKQWQAANDNSVSELFEQLLPNISFKFYCTQNDDILTAISSLNRAHDIDMLIVIPGKQNLFHKSQSGNFIFNGHIPTIALHANDFMKA
ncbi:universal stress protein [Parafilimonas sp.]|uniref:universal stress protein n=1 Tax=Parafilimonas sp. TaxID=1969739 RepID=UPI0039E2BD55